MGLPCDALGTGLGHTSAGVRHGLRYLASAALERAWRVRRNGERGRGQGWLFELVSGIARSVMHMPVLYEDMRCALPLLESASLAVE